MDIVQIDDQPIAATFFGEVHRLTDFVTPEALEIQDLYEQITHNIASTREKLTACWKWVTSNVRYVHFVKGKIWIEGESFSQGDLWQDPSMTIHTKVGNCANSAMLLTSLVRNTLPPDQAYCALGNLHSNQPGGHAWTQVSLDEDSYIMEATTSKAPPLVPASSAKQYEAVHYFNDKNVLAVAGKTQMVPYAECFSTWLQDYLNFTYIEEQRRLHLIKAQS